MHKQKTIKSNLTFTGIGQHRGTENKIELLPLPVNNGVVFEIDGQIYKLSLENVFGEGGYTSIGLKDGRHVKTIEHLISSIYGLGIDNILIRTNSEEIPIQDGSSYPLMQEIEKIGVIEQEANKKFIKILKEVKFKDDKAEVVIAPAEQDLLTLDVEIDYTGIKPIEKQRKELGLTLENYKNIIARARTFARMSDVEFLHSKGLCLGASLKSGIAVDEEKVLNPEGLRMPDEFVVHKILDAIGDLFVMGYPIIGKYTSKCGGHYHNNQLVRAVMADKSNYEIVEL